MAGKIITYLIGLITVVGSSCDCLQKVSGTVIDAATGQPIDSVLVSKRRTELKELTNSSGNFTLTAISGGICRCPPMQLNVMKTGYESKEVKIKQSRSKTIYLVRIRK